MSNFRKLYPDFAAVERHIQRAQAERAAMVGTWIAEAIVSVVHGVRRLFATPAPARRSRPLVVRASIPR